MQKALLWAAIDAQRLGVGPPLTADLLTAAARGYLTGAHPTDDWARPALTGLSRSSGPDDRATAPLRAAYDPTHRIVVGYEVADYLLQYATRTRRTARIPDATWRALTHHTDDPDDLTRLGTSAERRGLTDHAMVAQRKAADAGGPEAARWLAKRGELDELDRLRARADTGDPKAASVLAWALAHRGELDELRARADTGETEAATWLTWVVAQAGELDELRARAAAGEPGAAYWLAKVLAERGEVDELRVWADAGLPGAATWLAKVLAKRGDVDELRARADTGEHGVAYWLAWALAHRGELDELRVLAAAGDSEAADELARVLAKRGDLNELGALADGGHFYAAGSMRPACWRRCWPTGVTSTRYAPGLTTLGRPTGWRRCWPSGVTSRGFAGRWTPARMVRSRPCGQPKPEATRRRVDGSDRYRPQTGRNQECDRHNGTNARCPG